MALQLVISVHYDALSAVIFLTFGQFERFKMDFAGYTVIKPAFVVDEPILHP
jgi:hypothetical protein